MSKRWERQSAQPGVLVDRPRGIVFDWSTTVPADASVGFAPGCLYVDIDAAAGSQLWINEGTASSSAFKVIPSGASGTFTVATITTANITTANITTVVSNAFTLSAAASVFTIKAATQHSCEFTDGTTIMVDLDTRATSSGGGAVTLLGQPNVIASAGSALTSPTLMLGAKTVTLSGTTTTTSMFGVALNMGTQTLTDASVCTLSAASVVHIPVLAAAGGSLTITASYMISTGVSDCFLTNAGVWTDHSCFADGKNAILDATRNTILGIVEKLTPKTWTYRQDMHGDDFGRQRAGIVYDELPDELRAPGHEKAVAPGVLASFALAALKVLKGENDELRERLAALEAKLA